MRVSSLIMCACVFLSANFLFAQNADDVDLLLNTDFVQKNKQREVVYGFTQNPSKITLYNPVYHILSGSMWIYQKFISVQLSSECRYEPSCSAYSKQLIRDFGIVKGIVCSADRLMRCNRITLSGLPQSAFDPIDGKIHETTDRYTLK